MDKLKQKIKDRLGEKKTTSLKKSLKVARIVKNVICWLLIAVLTTAVIIFMITKLSGGTPNIFGYSFHRIVSGSMEPELSIGDVIVCKRVTDASDISVGDIITFQGDKRFENQKVTHRVLVAPYDDGRGNTVLVTKGDANEKDDGEIKFQSVESKSVAKMAFLRDVYDFFFSQWGLIIFIVLLLLIFFDEILNIVRLTVASSEQDETESFEEIVERIKREQLEASKAAELPSEVSDQSSPEDREKPEPDTADSSAEPAEEIVKPERTKEQSKEESKKTTDKNKQKIPKPKDKSKQQTNNNSNKHNNKQNNKQKNAKSGKKQTKSSGNASAKKKPKKESKKRKKR